MIEDRSVSLAPIRDAAIGVIGYGNQGRAQAQNLRDGGWQVRIGARTGGPSHTRASADGFTVDAPAAVARDSDLLMLLVPDEVLAELYLAELRPVLRPDGVVGFAHGAALAFGAMEFPPPADVILVAPTGPGTDLRERFVDGDGIPALVAVHQDGSGLARERALAYAKAIGCTRAGVWMTTVREEATIDLFGEQAVLCGGLAELVRQGFEILVDAGYPAQLAYLECVQQIGLTADLISRGGVEGMWDRVSATARYGGLLSGPEIVGAPSRAAMQETLRRIESGGFFRELGEDRRMGGARMAWLRERVRSPRLLAAGEEVRRALETAPARRNRGRK